jgi:Leucine-rich repeat (LRR) protein
MITSSLAANCRFFNQLTGYTCELSNVNVIEENQIIDIIGNHLSGRTDADVTILTVSQTSSAVMNFIPRRIFETFVNLRTIDFSNVNLREINSGTFFNCAQLSRITLNNNQLQRIPARTFENCGELREIIANANQITNLEDGAFNELAKLEGLRLSDNLIENIDPSVVEPLVNILGSP